MIDFVPYEAKHLAQIRLTPVHDAWRVKLLPIAGEFVGRWAWTGLIDGQVVGCAGLTPVPYWPTRAVAWAFFGKIPLRAWPAAIRHMRAVIADAHLAGHRRIEMSVVRGFAPGCVLAFKLGFVCETVMRCYGPDGLDHFLFAKVA